MKKNIAFSKPFIDKRELSAITKVFNSGWLTMGEETIGFENDFAKYVGAKYAVAVNSCTSALFLSLKLLGVKQGDEVIVPSFTFASSANVIVHCGATPVFVDIKPGDFTLDSKLVKQKITKKTKTIIPVHYAANLADTDYLVPVIEDSAHRISKNHNSSNIVCYSFYATKNLTTGEGGIITTDNKEQADWLIKARLHGLSRDAWKRYSPGSKWYYDVEFCGYKFNTIDLLAVMGRVQLKKFDQMQKKRERIINKYNKLLNFKHSGTHLYPILVEKRDQFMEVMKQAGISCSFHFLPLHLSPAFQGYKRVKLPVTEYVGQRVVTLPLFPGLSLEEVNYVAEKIHQFGEFKEGKFGLLVLN